MAMPRWSWLAALPVLTLGVVNCYSQGGGTAPPRDRFYFPVGLQVSPGGTVLYAINSDFDLQYSGGTLQSYDLRLIREHAVDLIKDPRDPKVPVLHPSPAADNPCPSNPPDYSLDGRGTRQPLGQTCAPAVDSTVYVRDSAIVGAFATDLLLSAPPAQLEPASAPVGTRGFDRLFAPIRGNASLTWASIERDTPDSTPTEDPAKYGPFRISCGQDASGRCDLSHEAGIDPNEQGNTRHITMPGEPFGIAISGDGSSIVVTHQNDPETSLFSTGLSRTQNTGAVDLLPPPTLEFVLQGMPTGGIGVVSVPHDPDVFLGTSLPLPLPAFLETTRTAAEVDLLRRYPDAVGSVGDTAAVQGSLGLGTSLRRPFLDREAVFPITPSAGGLDSRGIVIDPTPRIACKTKVAKADPSTGRTQDDVVRDTAACAKKPARVFIASRSPAAMLVGDIGGATTDGAAYDPDRLVLHSSIPLSTGPSRLYLAPIVDRDGAYALRVFAVCFDSATIFIYDPDTLSLENVIRVAPGPFAMTFDPFDLTAVANHEQVPFDPRETSRGLRRYRFAYIASFTESFVQLLDLDDAQTDPSTFERLVFTLGQPTQPKGT